MKTATILALMFLAFAAAGTSDYHIAAGMAAEHMPAVLAAQEARP